MDNDNSLAIDNFLLHPFIQTIFDRIDALETTDRTSEALESHSPIGPA